MASELMRAPIKGFLDTSIIVVKGKTSVFEVSMMLARQNVRYALAKAKGGSWSILTERDIVRRVVAHGNDPADVHVDDVATPCKAVVDEETSLETTLALMRDEESKLAVVTDGEDKPLGIVNRLSVLFGVLRMIMPLAYHEVEEERRTWLDMLLREVAEDYVGRTW